MYTHFSRHAINTIILVRSAAGQVFAPAKPALLPTVLKNGYALFMPT